jgi:hypothetical protein
MSTMQLNVLCIMATFFTFSGPGSAASPDGERQKDPKSDSAGKTSEREEAYLSAVKKCEQLEPKEKQHCIESVKERFGEMLR